MACNNTKFGNPCHDDIKNMDIGTMCKKLKEKKNLLDKLLDGYSGVSLLEALGSTSKIQQEIFNLLDINISEQQIANIEQTCETVVSQVQKNKITGLSPECLALVPEKDRVAAITTSKISNIRQRNKDVVIGDCVLSSISEMLSNMDASIGNTVLQDAIAQAQGLMSNSEIDQLTCNDINIKLSSCSFLQNNSCCKSNYDQAQANIIEAGCTSIIDDIIQDNDATIYQTCSITAQSSISSDISAAIINSVEQKAVAKSEGITPSFLIALAILLAVVIGGPLLAVGQMAKNLFKMAGVFLIICGGVFIYVYYSKIIKPQTYSNQPFSIRDNTSSAETIRLKYEDAITRFNTHKEFVAFDFFPDNKDNPLKIKPTQMGLAVFIDSFDNDADKISIEDDSDNSTCISKSKKIDSILYLYLGIIMAGMGVLITLIGFFKSSKK